MKFQSTLPCGSDLYRQGKMGTRTYFNPRSLAGATHWQGNAQAVTCISIHAPLRERHRCLIPCQMHPLNFNPRSLAGATMSHWVFFSHWSNFNPRSLAGATGCIKEVMPMLRISIHAPLRERRLTPYTIASVIVISIHAPLRERRKTRK